MFFGKKSSKRKILVLWYPYKENLGDYYLFKTVCLKAKEWGFCPIGMDVGSPYQKIVNTLKKCDFLWFAGGGIIERGIPNIIENFQQFYLEAKHIQYGVTGISVGEFDYRNKSKELSEWVNNALFFYARDEYSANLLNSIASNNRVCNSADVVFASEYLSNYVPKNITHCVGINFRKMPYPDLTGELDFNLWINSIKENYTEKIIAIPDEEDLLKKGDFFFEHYTPQNAVTAISQMDYGIAMRYHVVLIAALMGKICIPIDYCPKVSRLAKQLGIDDLIIHFNEPGELKRIKERYIQNEDHYKKILKTNVDILKDKTQNMFANVERLLKEKLL